MEYKIYKIVRIDTNNIVYVGLTKNTLDYRFKCHFKDKNRNKKKYNYFSKYKELLKIELLQDNISTIEQANKMEIHYISYYKKLGYNLLNITSGGDGTKNVNPWNKGLDCNYKNKLMDNSPNAKKIYMYSIDGDFIQEFNSIKKASEFTSIPRNAIKNIADEKTKYKTYKNLVFRYYKKDKIIITQMSKDDKIKLSLLARQKNIKKVFIKSLIDNTINVYDNINDCANKTKINKGTLYTYFSTNKQTNTKIYGYVK
jgi:hypothetical protein